MATDRIIEHIDRLREKPEHVRQRIAFLTGRGPDPALAQSKSAH